MRRDVTWDPTDWVCKSKNVIQFKYIINNNIIFFKKVLTIIDWLKSFKNLLFTLQVKKTVLKGIFYVDAAKNIILKIPKFFV